MFATLWKHLQHVTSVPEVTLHARKAYLCAAAKHIHAILLPEGPVDWPGPNQLFLPDQDEDGEEEDMRMEPEPEEISLRMHCTKIIQDNAAQLGEEELYKVELDLNNGVILKLRAILKHVCGSPQHQKSWLDLLEDTLKTYESLSDESLRMLILDVQTRWESTHDMLDLGIRYNDVIETYSDRHELPFMLHLSEKEWNSVEQVCNLSYSEHFYMPEVLILTTAQGEISKLMDAAVDKEYCQALHNCYYKLSDYHYHSDLSPYYNVMGVTVVQNWEMPPGTDRVRCVWNGAFVGKARGDVPILDSRF
ncbi:hypothetical protein BT69DRAFT_1295097 [Atractiella rhizophila]|nr:hypothetical protein BT69DRAFT_1295097 [Atractiella rhizophila]